MATERTEINFDRFTERSRRVLRRAKCFLGDFEKISPTDMLVAITFEEEGIGAQAMHRIGLGAKSATFARWFHDQPLNDEIEVHQTDLDKQAQDVLTLAAEAANRLNSHYIGTEHLLIGIADKIKEEVHSTLRSISQATDKP